MKYAILTVTTLFLFAIYGCNTGEMQQELNEVDSLYQEVERITVNLENYDAEMLAKKSKEAKDQLDFISKKWPRQDSLNRATAAFLGDYKANKKALGFFAEQIERMERECEYSLKQLDGLRNDIVNGVHTKEDLTTYLEDEKRATSVLMEGDSTLAVKYDKIIKRHNGLKTKVDSVILDMNKRGIR